jgi:hypothetical protein
MIYIISSKYIAATGKITYRYMFDAEGCDIDKIIALPYGYFWKSHDDRYALNLFESGKGLVFGIGCQKEELDNWIKEEPIPDCSVLMTNDNAEVLTELLKDNGIEFEWFRYSGEFLRTSE